jgi:hypothetical protein
MINIDMIVFNYLLAVLCPLIIYTDLDISWLMGTSHEISYAMETHDSASTRGLLAEGAVSGRWRMSSAAPCR